MALDVMGTLRLHSHTMSTAELFFWIADNLDDPGYWLTEVMKELGMLPKLPESADGARFTPPIGD